MCLANATAKAHSRNPFASSLALSRKTHSEKCNDVADAFVCKRVRKGHKSAAQRTQAPSQLPRWRRGVLLYTWPASSVRRCDCTLDARRVIVAALRPPLLLYLCVCVCVCLCLCLHRCRLTPLLRLCTRRHALAYKSTRVSSLAHCRTSMQLAEQRRARCALRCPCATTAAVLPSGAFVAGAVVAAAEYAKPVHRLLR